MSTTRSAEESRLSRFTNGAAVYIDDRTSLGGAVKTFGRKVFPDHWSFMLGEVALFSFIVILLSGTFLSFFFDPSMQHVEYQGSYVPLKGLEMSAAMASTLDISFDVRGGLLMRQVHHWAALLFNAAIGLHMLRVFFTGAFRKPREINWVVGFGLFVLALAAGFTGYSLPDDLLSGNGLRIIDGFIKAIPLIGVWISYFLFGGEFPGSDIVGRFYSLHILLIPAVILALIGIHLILIIAVHKHTQYPGAGKTEQTVVGYPILPVYTAKAGGFFFIIFGVIFLISSLFTINPIWIYGPYDPSPVSAGTQPDWYMGWTDGLLRLVPTGWEFVSWGGYTVSMNLLVVMIVAAIFLILVAAYPFIEAWITGDKREHHILDRPRDTATRTAIGSAGVTFYAVMWAAAGSDLIATHFQLDVFMLTYTLQALLILGPIIAFFLAKRICIGLQKKDREIVLHGYESGRIVRLPGGEFIEVHQPLDEYERWKLVGYHSDYKPVMLRPDAEGRITRRARTRAALSRWFFEDRIAPATSSDIEAGHSSEGH
ncbi:MAG: cytochrome bc1 complex cytochrome b subunit [Microbacteriaceae bacterium]